MKETIAISEALTLQGYNDIPIKHFDELSKLIQEAFTKYKGKYFTQEVKKKIDQVEICVKSYPIEFKQEMICIISSYMDRLHYRKYD
jgi:hypothetical protein